MLRRNLHVALFDSGYAEIKRELVENYLAELSEQLKDVPRLTREIFKFIVDRSDIKDRHSEFPQILDSKLRRLYKGDERDLDRDLEILSKGNPWEKAVKSSKKEGAGFRGDEDPYLTVNKQGWRKSFINADGDLEPANPLGKWKDQEVTLENHVDGGWRRHLKSNSPFTSFSVTDGTTARYTADGVGIILKLQELRSAIAAGKAPV